MPKRVTPKILDKFAQASNLRGNELSDRIAELERRLADSEAVQEMPLERIKPNPNQPRSSFYVVQQKMESLKQYGQKTPIILTQPPNCDYYQIWDGECRYRSAIKLKWPTIKAIVVPHNEKTYELDVLVSAVHDDGLNSFDLARNLVKVIQYQLSNSDSRQIYNKLNSALVRLKRNGRQEDLKGLEKRSFESREEILQSLELSSEELVIFQTILNFRQNLGSFCNNKFPLLFLYPEIETAIKEQGLGDVHAIAINSIKPENKKITITEEEAKNLRRSIIENCLSYNLNCSETKKQVREAIAPYLNKTETLSNKIFKRSIAKVQAIETKGLEQEQKQLLIKALKEKIDEIESSK